MLYNYSLEINLPIRGGVSIGKFRSKTISSYTVNKFSRWGIPQMFTPSAVKYDSSDWATKAIPAVEIPVHFGDALTDAYLLESQIPSIGVFMDANILKKRHSNLIKELLVRGEIVSLKLKPVSK